MFISSAAQLQPSVTCGYIWQDGIVNNNYFTENNVTRIHKMFQDKLIVIKRF